MVALASLFLARQAAVSQEAAEDKPAVKQQAEGAAKKTPLKRQWVQFRIVADPELNLIHEAILNNVAFDESLIIGALGPISREAAKAAAAGETVVEVGPVPAPPGQRRGPPVSILSSGSALLEVEVRFYDDRVAPHKFLYSYSRGLLQRLGRLDVRHQQDISDIQRLEETVERHYTQLKESKEAIVKLATLSGISVSPEANEQRLARIESELEAVAVEIAGLEARQKVLEEQIAQHRRESRGQRRQGPCH